MVDRVQEAPFLMSHNGLEARPTIPGGAAAFDDRDLTAVCFLAVLAAGTDAASERSRTSALYTVGPNAGQPQISGFNAAGAWNEQIHAP